MNPKFRSISSSLLDNLSEHQVLITSVIEHCFDDIQVAAEIMVQVLDSGGTIFWCGNGGSAADCQHLAAELIGRFKSDRRPLASASLSTDTSVLTCIANDYSFDCIFSRQLQALARPGDLLVVISTSGNSPNILKVIQKASDMGLKSIGLLGRDGGKAKSMVGQSVVVPSFSTARIQELHILIGHCLCDIIEIRLNLSNLPLSS